LFLELAMPAIGLFFQSKFALAPAPPLAFVMLAPNILFDTIGTSFKGQLEHRPFVARQFEGVPRSRPLDCSFVFVDDQPEIRPVSVSLGGVANLSRSAFALASAIFSASWKSRHCSATNASSSGLGLSAKKCMMEKFISGCGGTDQPMRYIASQSMDICATWWYRSNSSGFGQLWHNSRMYASTASGESNCFSPSGKSDDSAC